MAISLAQRFRLAEGSEGDFSERVMAQLHREAVYRLGQGADGPDLLAVRAIWANVSNYRFPITLAVLNDQFIGAESPEAITDQQVEAAVATQWATFVAVYFPAPAE